MRYFEDGVRFATLQQALENQNVDELKKLLAVCQTAERPTRKADIVDVILAQMRGDSLRATWNRLDTLQQAAVSEAVYSEDSRYNKARFLAKYGKEPNLGASDTRHGYSYGYAPSLLGLFLHGYILPEDLKAQLKSFVPAPPPLTLKTIDEIPSVYDLITTSYSYASKKTIEASTPLAVTIRNTERDALQEIPTVLRLISTGKVAVSEKTQQPTATVVKAIGALLSNGDYYDNIALLADEETTEKTEEKPGDTGSADTSQNVAIRRGSLREIIEDDEEDVGPIKAFAWTMLMQGARLTALTGKKLALSPAGQKALLTPAQEVTRSLWQNWLKSDIFDELRRINAIRGQTGNGKSSLTKPATRRAAIVQTLNQCPAGKWVDINAFLRYLRAEHDFTVTRDEWSLYISDANYGGLGGADTWYLLQARYTLCFLFEYAATLGLIDLAYVPPASVRNDSRNFWGADNHTFLSRYDGLLYLRVNALGAYCLGQTQTYTPPAREQTASLEVLRVLPNRDVVITDLRAASGDALILSLYAEKTSERVYQLNQAKMLAAVESGRDLQELRDLLTTRSAEPLPPVIDRFLQDVEDRSQRVQDRGPARLIECADAVTAQLIAHDPRTKRYCLAAGERHLIVAADSEAAFRKGLRQLGYILPPARPERK